MKTIGSVFNQFFDRDKGIEIKEQQLRDIESVKAVLNTDGWRVIRDCLNLHIQVAEQSILALSQNPVENERKILLLNEGRSWAHKWLNSIEAVVAETPKLQKELEQLTKRSLAPGRDQRAA